MNNLRMKNFNAKGLFNFSVVFLTNKKNEVYIYRRELSALLLMRAKTKKTYSFMKHTLLRHFHIIFSFLYPFFFTLSFHLCPPFFNIWKKRHYSDFTKCKPFECQNSTFVVDILQFATISNEIYITLAKYCWFHTTSIPPSTPRGLTCSRTFFEKHEEIPD